MQSLRDTDPAAFAQYMRAKYGEDDARLAAAAPDLLAALQACARAYEDSVPADQKWTLGTNLAPDWYKFARAAIARATGPTDDQFLAALGPCGK